MKISSILFTYLFLLSSFAQLPALSEKDIPINKCSLNRTDHRKGELAICTIFRDEASYLKEWIEYHRLVGVSHFYLYNNLSQDTFWDVLRPYVEKGIVELFDVPFDSYAANDGAITHNFVQVTCYNHAIKLSKRSNEWLAIIDSDEFICPVIDDTIPAALARYKDAGGIVVYWQIYGTSNVIDLMNGELLIEKLLYKEPNLGGNGMFKTIIRPRNATCIDPHWTKATGDLPLLMPNHHKFRHSPNHSSLPVDIIRINHYTYRTESYYFNFKKPRRARWGNNPSYEMERAEIDHANSNYDPIMLRFVDQLKKSEGALSP